MPDRPNGRCSAIAQAVSCEAWGVAALRPMPVMALPLRMHARRPNAVTPSASDAAPQASVYAMATAIEY
ncbi:hypothetical protein EYR05_18200 [Xanthomonas oryzae pv. oryzae]|nr:hypothetical protein EYR03_18390 [Xanthomonas oryzae pv. oryzae]TAO92830.1 hypothetical protein EYR05_18200 [Xanthomonas oryzae pv. oryzae]TAP18463.1 hypothetical protein EYR01_17340 [Xanthomonas oryzae pv. oryzae]